MHDLNTINRLNREAFERAVGSFQARGRFVLATYEGATLTAIETFSTANELVDAHSEKLKNTPLNQGTHFKCLSPTAGFHATQRDQSEDRPTQYPVEQLAAFGASSPVKPDVTLGDYIARKST